MICRYTGTMLIYRNSLLIIYKQNSLKSQENVKTKYVSVIQLLSMDIKVHFGNVLKERFGNSTAFNWSPISSFFN